MVSKLIDMASTPTQKKSHKKVETLAKRDSDMTKVRILDAALQVFARVGLMGARTEVIAAQTGVTKAMIFYYFDSKEKLYQTVLKRAFNSIIQGIKQNHKLEELPPFEALEYFLRQLFQNVTKNPNIVSTLFLESIQNQGQYYPKDDGEMLYETLSGILKRGMVMSEFRPLEPNHTAVNIVGTCMFYFCVDPNIKFLWSEKGMLSKDMLEQHANEAIDLILTGVRK